MNNEQLEIAKKIAEIEGLELAITYDKPNGILLNVQLVSGYARWTQYNPFEWPILGPLMVKYEVDISRVYHEESQECFTNFCINNETGMHQTYRSERLDIPTAILECIIKASNTTSN